MRDMRLLAAALVGVLLVLTPPHAARCAPQPVKIVVDGQAPSLNPPGYFEDRAVRCPAAASMEALGASVSHDPQQTADDHRVDQREGHAPGDLRHRRHLLIDRDEGAPGDAGPVAPGRADRADCGNGDALRAQAEERLGEVLRLEVAPLT